MLQLTDFAINLTDTTKRIWFLVFDFLFAMAYKVLVTIEHDCLLKQLQMRIGDNFSVYCTNYYDFFFYQNTAAGIDVNQVLSILKYDKEAKYDVYNFKKQSVIILPCNGKSRDHLMHFYGKIFSEFGIVFSYPQIKSDGEQYFYHCLDSESHAAVLSLFKNETSFQINSIIEYPVDDYYGNYMFSIPDLSNTLTPYQHQILFDAYKEGYYKIPRAIRTIDIAEMKNKTRYSVDKILRKAENKIMTYIHPFLH